jgi:hypothetical protein
LTCFGFSNPGELWAPLVGKAYAKLHGSLENMLVGGGGANVAAVLRDMTGCPTEELCLRDNEVRLKQESGELWSMLQAWAGDGWVPEEYLCHPNS